MLEALIAFEDTTEKKMHVPSLGFDLHIILCTIDLIKKISK